MCKLVYLFWFLSVNRKNFLQSANGLESVIYVRLSRRSKISFVYANSCLFCSFRGAYHVACTVLVTYLWICQMYFLPLPSNRHHRSNGDCLEGKRETYQVCSVQYSAQQMCIVQCTHIWTDLTVLWNGFCLTGPISLCLDSFLYVYYCMHA